MEEKFLKEILDVVIDIKAEQKTMREKMSNMEEKVDKITTEQKDMKKVLDNVVEEQKGMKQVLDNVVEEQKGMKQLQQEMKQVQNVMCQDIKYLLSEQADTKNIVIELVNKVGEMDLNNKAKIYQFPKR